MNEDADSGGNVVVSFNYPGSEVACVLKIRQSQDADSPRFVSYSDEIIITSSGFLRTVVMKRNDILN